MNSFLLRSSWGLLWKNIWLPLGKKTYAPDDMFIELYRCGCRKLRIHPIDEALSDAKLAKAEFKKMAVPSDEKDSSLIYGHFDECHRN
jgi:hypothetical protein